MESECKALRNEAPKHSINQVISNNINLRSNTGQLQDESYNSSINQEKHYNQMQPGMGPPYNQMQPGMGPPYNQMQPGMGPPYNQMQPGMGLPYNQMQPGMGPPYNQMQPGIGPPYNQMQSGMGPQVTTAGTSDPSKNKLLALLAQNSMNAYLAYSANE